MSKKLTKQQEEAGYTHDELGSIWFVEAYTDNEVVITSKDYPDAFLSLSWDEFNQQLTQIK